LAIYIGSKAEMSQAPFTLVRVTMTLLAAWTG
jgi:hypothetical protein